MTALVWILSLALLQAPVAADGQAVYAKTSEAVVMVVVRNAAGDIIGQGSAFVIEGGFLVTNAHVVRGGAVFVKAGPLMVPCKVERLDELNDLALLKPASEVGTAPLRLSAGVPGPGARLFALGNPQGLERTITEGLLTGQRTLDGRSLLQMSAAVSPGSSGGPVVDGEGAVVGVVVAALNDSQNLNFAIPASAVMALLNSPVATIAELIRSAESAAAERANIRYTREPQSEWQRLFRREAEILESALAAAQGDQDVLQVANAALLNHGELALSAARRAQTEANTLTPEHHAILARAARDQSWLHKGAARDGLVKEALTAAQIAHALKPDLAHTYLLADIQEDAGLHSAAYVNFQKVVDGGSAEHRTDAIRGLARTARAMSRVTEAIAWYRELEKGGGASDWDTLQHAEFMADQRQYTTAAFLYETLAVKPTQFTLRNASDLWSEAALTRLAAGENDLALRAARAGIAAGAKERNSEMHVATLHLVIAVVLNSRGVHEQAIEAARQAAMLDPKRDRAFSELAEALNGAQRFAEAEAAAKTAVALSDGASVAAHFQLGSAYFEQKQWALARQSFEHAARLDPTSSAAAYNVAVSLYNARFYSDAIYWYEETLRRDPKHKDRVQILAMIARLKSR